MSNNDNARALGNQMEITIAQTKATTAAINLGNVRMEAQRIKDNIARGQERADQEKIKNLEEELKLRGSQSGSTRPGTYSNEQLQAQLAYANQVTKELRDELASRDKTLKEWILSQKATRALFVQFAKVAGLTQEERIKLTAEKVVELGNAEPELMQTDVFKESAESLKKSQAQAQKP